MPGLFGDTEYTVEEIESMFNGDSEQETPTANDETPAPEQPTENQDKGTEQVEQTKAFAKRLRESTDKTRSEEREAIAKQMGFNSYDEMIKLNERKHIEEKGFDPDQISPLVEELVQKRLESDPRMAELAKYRDEQVKEFGRKELAEITELTGGEVTSFNQLPKEVIDLWTKNGSLKSAFMQIEGEKYIRKIRSEQSKGTTSHLVNPSGGPNEQINTRPLTEEEKNIYKYFVPSITDDELNKKTKKIN